jgi:hypothetical protein
MYAEIYKKAMEFYGKFIKVECIYNDFTIKKDSYSKSVTIKKNGFKFVITQLDNEDIQRMEYVFTVANAIKYSQNNPLLGFTRKEIPAFAKIKELFPNADKYLYSQIDIHNLSSVLNFLSPLDFSIFEAKKAIREKNLEELEAKERKKNKSVI